MKFSLESLFIGGLFGGLAGLGVPQDLGTIMPDVIQYAPESMRWNLARMSTLEALLIVVPSFDAVMGLIVPEADILRRSDTSAEGTTARPYTIRERFLSGAYEAVRSAISLTAGYAIGYGVAYAATTYFT